MHDLSKSIQRLSSLCPHPSWIEINIAQFNKNIRAIRKLIGDKRLCMTVKANAYGHGLCEMGKAAQEAGVDYLGVSCLKEGADLRLAGIKIPILVFGAIHEDQIRDLIEFDLEFSVSSPYKADLVKEKCGQLNRQCRVHVEVDTGMHRTGMRPETALALLEKNAHSNCLNIVGIYSHFATSDVPNHPFAQQQIQELTNLAKKVGREKFLWHLANSGGVAFYPHSHFDMVRPGLLCYGYFPDGSCDPLGEIAPCLSIKARVSYFKVVPKGSGISYGHQYVTNEATRVVTIPVGYGDGYRRIFSNQANVLIHGKRYRVAGTVCMDQFMVDIGSDSVFVGDEATLIGRQGSEEVSLQELSQIGNTIPYELLCGFNERLPRIYTY